MASDESWESGKVYAWVRRSISILFLVCAVLQVIPEDGNWQQATQMSLFGNSGFQPQPKMFSHPVMWLTDWIFNGDHAVVVNFLETALLLYASAIAWWWKNWSAWFRGFVYVWLFFTWWFGMDFGYLFSGLSTDLNTAPVVFLILWSQSPRFHMAQKTTSNG